MKKLFVTSMVFGASIFLATAASAVITGSAHDLSATGVGGNNPEGQLCIFCHTPHHADTTVEDAPLWNHEVTATAVFTVYTSGSLDAVVGQPSGVSKLCLSCHDGTVALDAFGGMAGTSGTIGIDGDVGTDLSNDHPISFTYDAALATTDGELFDPTSTASGVDGGDINDDMLFGVGNDRLECASCHDVHNSYNITSLLRKSNAGSALCMTCHDK